MSLWHSEHEEDLDADGGGTVHRHEAHGVPGPCESAEPSSIRDGQSEDEHHEEEGHSHHHERIRDRGRLLATLALTCSMMAVEAVGGWYAGSLALLSDAGHMLTDAAALLLATLAVWFAGRPADLKRTYGYFRLETLSALANGAALIAIAVLIGYEAWQRIAHPQPLKVGLMLAVAVVGLLVNLGGIMLLARSKSMNVRGAFLHVLGDALSSVGVIAAGAIAWVTGSTLPDPVISIVIASIIAVGSVGLIRQAVHVLLEAVPEHIDLVQVFAAMKSLGGVRAVHDLHVWTITHHLHALSAHLVVEDACLAAGRHDEILASARSLLKNRFGIDHSTLQIESESFARKVED